ncbi:hypothetical protein DVH24_028830, partial [Malus domestica]
CSNNNPVIDLGGVEGDGHTCITEQILKAKDKANLYFDDLKKSCWLLTSSGYFDLEDVRLWRDYLRHPCQPLEECM